MKIIVPVGTRIHDGHANALTACGLDVVRWDKQEKPAFDLFSEVKPSVFVGVDADFQERAFQKCLASNPNVRVEVVPHGAWGDITSWKKRKPEPEFECDLAVIDTYDPVYHRIVLEATRELKVKVFGDGGWPLPQFVGKPPADKIGVIYASAVVTLTHCPKNDSLQHLYDVWLSGGVPFQGFISKLVKDVRRWKENPSEREKRSNDEAIAILEAGTYFDALIDYEFPWLSKTVILKAKADAIERMNDL